MTEENVQSTPFHRLVMKKVKILKVKLMWERWDTYPRRQELDSKKEEASATDADDGESKNKPVLAWDTG